MKLSSAPNCPAAEAVSHRAIVVEDDVQNTSAADCFNALFGGVVEEELVELGSLHVPGAPAGTRVVLRKQKRRRFLAAAAHELHSDFLDERALIEIVENAQPLENPIGLWH
jgi:hypothetical protein